jgi:hypothetical protein
LSEPKKIRRCRCCRKWFEPPMHLPDKRTCSGHCAIIHARMSVKR